MTMSHQYQTVLIENILIITIKCILNLIIIIININLKNNNIQFISIHKSIQFFRKQFLLF